VFVVIQVVGGVGGVDLLVSSRAVLGKDGAVIGCKYHVVEAVIEGGIEYPKAIGGSPFKLRLLVGEGVEVGRDISPGVALLAEDDEALEAAAR
jgi:hypothetical protein